MKNIRVLTLLIISLNLWGCLKDSKMDQFSDDAISSTIAVEVTMPDGYDSYETSNLLVTLNDPSTGLKFSGETDANGVATIKVAPGSYFATAETKHSTGKVMYIFNGTSDKIRVTPKDPKHVEAKVALNVSKSGQLIIAELYYGGCTNPADGKSYTSKDTYIKIYNNSEDVAYLDSLCVGVADPWIALSSGKASPWVKNNSSELRDSVPNSLIGWMFPGTGTDHPLQPGEFTIVCLNGINHTLVCSTSINLAVNGYWAMYDPILTKSQTVPEPGVNLMYGFWKCGTSTAYIVAPQGPAVFLYTMGGKTPAQFVADTYTWKPGASNRNFDCLMVDKNLVIDGVECLRNTTDTKRFRPEIDNGFTMVDGTGTGQAVQRKVDATATLAAGGRIVYQDTNNSSNDFEKKSAPSLK